MVIFNSYVKLPRGYLAILHHGPSGFVCSFIRPTSSDSLRLSSDCESAPWNMERPPKFFSHQNGEKRCFFSWSYHHFWPLEMIVWGYGLFSDRPKWGNVGYFLDWKFWKSKHGQKRQENHQAKTFRKKHRKSQDFALNKDTSLAKICVRKNTFSKYLTWLWNFYTSE